METVAISLMALMALIAIQSTGTYHHSEIHTPPQRLERVPQRVYTNAPQSATKVVQETIKNISVSPEQQAIVEKYIRENIVDLSSKKAVLGGKFYVTEIQWIDENTVEVRFEDGHIALEGNLDFKMKNGNIQVEQFEVREL